MNLLKKFFQSSGLEHVDLSSFWDERVLTSLFLYNFLQSQKELRQHIAKIFSIFQESPEYRILMAFVKHGILSKSKLGEILVGDHTQLWKGPLSRSFEKLVRSGVIVEVKKNKRGTKYNIAPEYEPLIKLLIKIPP